MNLSLDAKRCFQVLEANGILSYMAYADEKLAEEEARARRYLDLSKPDSVDRVSRDSWLNPRSSSE